MELLITERGVIVAERIIEGIAINPTNEPPERVEHLRRSDEEMELWLGRPYVVRIEGAWQVRCLDCKSSDRPSRWETVTELDEAVAVFPNVTSCNLLTQAYALIQCRPSKPQHHNRDSQL